MEKNKPALYLQQAGYTLALNPQLFVNKLTETPFGKLNC